MNIGVLLLYIAGKGEVHDAFISNIQKKKLPVLSLKRIWISYISSRLRNLATIIIQQENFYVQTSKFAGFGNFPIASIAKGVNYTL